MYISSFIKIIKYFGKDKIFKLFLFILMSIIAGGLEFIGIALIYPFVVLLINQDANFIFLHKLPSIFQNLSHAKLALIFGLIALITFLVKNLYMIFYLYVQSKFLGNWVYRINNMLIQFFLYGPYNIVQKISSADKLYFIDILVPKTINDFINRVLALLTNSIILFFIVGLVLYKFFIAGIITILFASFCILFQNLVFRNKIKNIAQTMLQKTKLLNNITYSIVNSIKEVKIQGVEKEFTSKYMKSSKDVVNLQVNNIILSSISPHLVEMFVVFSIMILAGVIIWGNTGTTGTLVASFALIAASIFRLAPILNRIQSCLINISATHSYAKKLINFYEKYEFVYFNYEKSAGNVQVKFENKIIFRNVNFSYEPGKPILKNISFEINNGDFIGIIGLSGAGKTTLADVLTGLLPIDSGEIIVDGIPLNRDNFRSFRKNIGYVSQDSEILECSFRENVAWGIDPKDIDDEKVVHLLKDVQLWDLVESYEDGIYAEPIIGDSGLSGGQKQRLAIARVLYKNPSILLFDEATSAMDVKTEHDITSMIKEFVSSTKTMIAIAHRLSTLKACNKLVYLKDGAVVDIGTFDELSNKYSEFAELVRLSNLKSENTEK